MIALYILCIVFIITPFFPAIGNQHWFFRTADFVRLQSIAIEIVCILLLVLLTPSFSTWDWILLFSLIGATTYQIFKVFPYSSLYPRKKPDSPQDGMFSLLAANVLQTNNSFGKFIAEIDKFDPDVVLTMESNSDWEEGLSEIEKTYPYTVKVPLDNFYGMHLYSKIKLENTKINYHIEEDVPSILCEVPINDKTTIFLACLHPAPPSPTENETSKERDAELMTVGKKIRDIDKPVVVCGDMNDVVWSRPTRLFKKMANMIDPRIGRGFFPTYHAGYRFMRFPLDHLFHTKDLFIGKMIRTENFDSDHFGMYYEVFHKKKVQTPPNPKLNGDDKKEIEDLIQKAK